MCALRTTEATPPHTQILLKAKCGSRISDICTIPQGHTHTHTESTSVLLGQLNFSACF